MIHFLIKTFFIQLDWKTAFHIQNIELSSIHVAQKLLILFLNLSELKKTVFSIHNSELNNIYDIHRKC